MAKVKMDLKMGEWVADHIKAEDFTIFPFEFEECDKCGAMYLEQFGHDCNKVVELEMHDAEDGDEITPIEGLWHVAYHDFDRPKVRLFKTRDEAEMCFNKLSGQYEWVSLDHTIVE